MWNFRDKHLTVTAILPEVEFAVRAYGSAIGSLFLVRPLTEEVYPISSSVHE